MGKHKQERLGEWYAIITVIMYAFWPIGTNVIAKQMPPIQFLAYVTLLGAVPVLISTIYLKQVRQLFNARILGRMFLYTLLIAVIPYGVITYSSQFTTAIDTAFLTQTEGIFAAFMGWLIFKEHIKPKKLIGIGFILGANILLLYKGVEFSAANLAIALSPIGFVFANVIAKQLQKEGVGWAPILLFRSLVGGGILLAVAAYAEALSVPPEHLWLPLVLMGLVIFGLQKIFWQLALHRLDLSKCTAIINTMPVLSFFLAFLILDEVPTLSRWVALGLMVVGILFIMQTHSKQWIELEQ